MHVFSSLRNLVSVTISHSRSLLANQFDKHTTATGPGPGCALGQKPSAGPCLSLVLPALLHPAQHCAPCPPRRGSHSRHPLTHMQFLCPQVTSPAFRDWGLLPSSLKLPVPAAKGLAFSRWVCGSKGSRYHADPPSWAQGDLAQGLQCRPVWSP